MEYDQSSANPQVLYHYSDQMDHVTAALRQSEPQLRAILAEFISRCTAIPHHLDTTLVDQFVQHRQRLQSHDRWVREVGLGFEKADQLGPESMMNDLHHVIDTLYLKHPDGVEYPIKVVRIGPGEYLVLIAGTDTDGVAGSNDWPSNLRTGENMPSEYLRQVQRAMESANIPQGAKIHLAGHSQGGNVAMVLADIQSFVDQYSIQSISTFGSPPSAPINPRLGQDKYHNFAFITDPVPYTTDGLATSLTAPLVMLLDPFLSLSLRTSQIAPRSENQTILEVPDGLMSHSDYKYSDYLKRQDLPFEVKEWTVVEQFEAGDPDALRQDFDDLTSGDRSRQMRGLFNGLIELRKHALVNILQDVTTTVTYNAPEPIRTTVDRGLDWLAMRVTSGPRPSESLASTLQGVIDLQIARLEGQQQIAQGLWEGGSDLINAQIRANQQILQGAAEGDRIISEGVTQGADKMLSGDVWQGGVEIGSSVAEGTARTVDGYIEGATTSIAGTIEGASTIAEGAASGVTTTVKGVWDAAGKIGDGFGNFLF